MNVSASENGSSQLSTLTLLSVGAMILSVTSVAWLLYLTARKTRDPPEDVVLLRSGSYPLSRLLPSNPVIEPHGLWVVEETPQEVEEMEEKAQVETPLEDPQTQTCWTP